MDHVVVEPDHRSFARVARALDDEAGGEEWRTELAAELHAVLEPGVAAVRGALMGMATGGLDDGHEPLRAAVAAGVESQVRVDGRRAGVRIRARKIMLRNFANAPKRLNSRRGWRHPVFGDTETWVTQIGQPGWFDDPLRRLHARLHAAAARALDNRARRIARRG
ncbi:hypothetical protein O7630_34450 [Micromonospora sp. WMMD718]|uniref:hypothetical protein n=1 Tax=Micromonospora TaxID=1873 RepID=UPI001656B37D|nr:MULTISPECIES: hypothetical protein [Micromonospora]MBC9001293.1 hypothetical protein [Micromonospora aurantiaca]MDG4756047.1 hypothetical protein [Micromonospora sp. WMMD718]